MAKTASVTILESKSDSRQINLEAILVFATLFNQTLSPGEIFIDIFSRIFIA